MCQADNILKYCFTLNLTGAAEVQGAAKQVYLDGDLTIAACNGAEMHTAVLAVVPASH